MRNVNGSFMVTKAFKARKGVQTLVFQAVEFFGGKGQLSQVGVNFSITGKPCCHCSKAGCVGECDVLMGANGNRVDGALAINQQTHIAINAFGDFAKLLDGFPRNYFIGLNSLAIKFFNVV